MRVFGVKTLALLLFSGVVGPVSAAGSAGAEAPFYFVLAQAYTQEGSFREAMEAFEKAVELEPREPFIRMEYAELLLRLGRAERSVEHAAAARRLAPSNPDALRLFAFVHRRLADSSPESRQVARQAFIQLHQMAPEDAEAAMTLAQLYLSEDQPEDAAIVLEETLELRPRSRMLISLLAETLDRSGESERAEAHLATFLEGNPGYLRGRLALAELAARRGDHRRAAELLEATPGETRGAVEVLRDLALAYYRSGRPELSLAEVDAWLELEPRAATGRLLKATLLSVRGDDAGAEIELRRVLEGEPDHFRAVSLLAELLERGDREEEAVELLRAAATSLGDAGKTGASAQLLLRLVDLRIRAGDWESVLALTTELGPVLDADSSVEVSMVRAQAFAELNRKEEALDVLAGLRDQPKVWSRATAAHAELSFELGRREAAIAALNELGGSAELSDVLLAAQSLQRLELYAESIPILRRADAMSGGSTDVLFWLGAAYEREGQQAEAEREFRRLLALRPDFAPALNYLGYMWADRGVNLDEAVAMVARAVEIEPDNGAYVDSLGWAYYRLGRYEEARGHLERAARLVGDDSVVFEHLGDLYLAVGEVEQARLNYERALALGGENDAAVREKLRELGGTL